MLVLTMVLTATRGFPLALGALSGPVRVSGLRPDSVQGDRRILEILSGMGAAVNVRGHTVRVQNKGPFRPVTEDVSGIPDMVPALAALLMHAQGESRLENAGRLRLKESDRLESVCEMVNALGGSARIEGDCLIISGRPRCPGGTVRGYSDHRIVMAALVGASRCAGPSVIEDAEAVEKSYPSFWEHIRALGGKIHVIGLR